MKICRAGRRAEKGATGSSNNQGRKRVGSREDIKQAENQGERQILGMMERIHGEIRHLGRKRKLRKCRGS